MRLAIRLGFLLASALGLVVVTSCSDDEPPDEVSEARDAGAKALPQDARPNDLDSGPPVSTMRIAHLAPELGPIDFCYQTAQSGTFVGPVLESPAAPRGDGGDGGDDGYADGDADGGDADAPAASVPDAASVADAESVTDAESMADAESVVDAGSDADAGLALPTTGRFRTVSRYLDLAAVGPVTIAIVEAGARSCSNALVRGNVTLDPGKLSTVVLFARRGDGGSELELASFTDDRSTLPDKMRARVIHAALGTKAVAAAGPLAVRVVAARTTVLADRVEPRKAATPSDAISVDSLGYVTAPPVPPPASIAIGPATTSAGADAGFDPWRSRPRDLDLRGDSLHTAFVLTGDSEATFEVLWCADTTTQGSQTTCKIVR